MSVHTQPPRETEFLVIGAGVAGLRAAIELAERGKVAVLAKRSVSESNTQWAQGGIAAALSDEDEIGLHYQDTLLAGDGLCNPEAAQVLVEEAPERIEELIGWGTKFDREGTKLSFGREGAHSRNRILHAHGDSTGQEIQRALYAKACSLANISVHAFEFSIDLIEEGSVIRGVELLDENGARHRVFSRSVLLATGGMGQLYRNTTNPPVATGDGTAMAYRAGAAVADMEFIQFHPTALFLESAPRFLLSEALRGEGAYLRNGNMERFMTGVHEMAELAPRDVVARAIVRELQRGGADSVVYLDLRHLEAERVRSRFPKIFSTCKQYGLDIATDLIPVRPAAHYAMGGVKTDLHGRSTLGGLYAAGEAASTGVHGANRLASNSLLEGLVFGARAGKAMSEDPSKGSSGSHARGSEEPPAQSDEDEFGAISRTVQDLMWDQVGILRDATGLKSALTRLDSMSADLKQVSTRRGFQARNLCITGSLVARSALAREESRGAHFRLDFPQRDDQRFLKHCVIEQNQLRFE